MKAEKRKRLEAAGWTVGTARELLEGAAPFESPSFTMSIDAQKLLNDALTLPANDRAHLAAELLASLEADIEAARTAEIARRAKDARENPEDEDDWRSALTEVKR